MGANANVRFETWFFNFAQYDTVNWTVDRVSWIFCGAFGPHVFQNGFAEDISVATSPNTCNFLYIFAFGSNSQCLDIVKDLTINWGSSALLAVCSVTESSSSSEFTRDLRVSNVTCRTNLANNVVPPLLFEIFQPVANAGKPKYSITFSNVDVFPALYDWRAGTLAGDESSKLIGTYRGKRYNSVTRSNSPGTTEDFPQDLETIWIDSGSFRPSTANTGAVEVDYGGTRYRAWSLSSGANQGITANLGLNTNRNVKYSAKIYFVNNGAGSGDVRFQFFLQTASAGQTLDASGSGWTEIVASSAEDILTIAADAQSAEFSWNKGEVGAIRVVRTGADVGDTLGNDVAVLGVLLEPVL